MIAPDVADSVDYHRDISAFAVAFSGGFPRGIRSTEDGEGAVRGNEIEHDVTLSCKRDWSVGCPQ